MSLDMSDTRPFLFAMCQKLTVRQLQAALRRIKRLIQRNEARLIHLIHEHRVSAGRQHNPLQDLRSHLCENVPRPTSWPEIRTSHPSFMSVPKAIASAVAKSTFPSPSSDFRREETCRFNLEWTFYLCQPLQTLRLPQSHASPKEYAYEALWKCHAGFPDLDELFLRHARLGRMVRCGTRWPHVFAPLPSQHI